MNGGANRGEALQSEDGLAAAGFRFGTPQLAAGSFIPDFFSCGLDSLSLAAMTR
jgi:hypothetical protein